MTFPVSTQSYTQATGSASNAVFITVFFTRNPTANDIQFPISKRWVNTNTVKEFILVGFTTTAGVTQAIWLSLTNGTGGGVDELSGNSGTNPVTPDFTSNINIRGDSTSINISGDGVHTLTANVVLPSTPNVVLIGETTSISSVSNGTEGQVLTSHTSGPPTFQSSSSGLTLGPFGSTPNADAASITTGVLTLEPADATHPGGIALGPQTLGNGIKTFTDSPILPLTGILIGNGASQVTQNPVTNNAAIIAGASNTLASVVLSNGQFVIGATSGTPSAGTITAGTGISVTPGPGSITVSSTATGTVWSSQTSNFSALSGNGYAVSANAIGALPASPALGNTIVFYVFDSAVLTIQAASGQKILIGPSVSSFTGTCTNAENNSSLTLTCISVGPTYWGNINGPQGTWLTA